MANIREIGISSPQGEHHQIRVQECNHLCPRAQQAAVGSGEVFVHEEKTGMSLITCFEDPVVVCKPELDKRTR